MSTRLTPLVPHEFFHCYNRGTEKRVIFLDGADYKRFVELLYLCNCKKQINVRDIRKSYHNIFEYDRIETLVSIGTYCLMPNHFHILVTSAEENQISLFMNKLGTAY